MDDCGVEHDHVGEAKTGVRPQPRPADGSIVVDVADVVRVPQGGGGGVERSEPGRCKEALGERHRVKEHDVVGGGVTDGGRGGVASICGVS